LLPSHVFSSALNNVVDQVNTFDWLASLFLLEQLLQRVLAFIFEPLRR